MRTWVLAAGAAALAITAPALADPKGDKGGGKGQSAKAERGGGKAQAERGGGRDKADRGNQGSGRGQPAKAAKDDRGDDRRGANAAKVDDNRGRGRDRDQVRTVRADRDDNRDRVRVRDLDDRDVRIVHRDFDGDLFPGRGRGLLAGCPPGLDKKDNGCLPPGQVKQLLGTRLAAGLRDDLVPFPYRRWFRDNDDYLFRAGNGYIYRVDRDDFSIAGLIPMAGSGYYAIGDPWPSPYNFYNVPYQYRTLWNDNDDYLYRYSNGAIYAVDRDSMAVNGIVSLLAGDLGMGQPLPLGYDAYNVPLAYRTTYYDTPDAWYRYNDGYFYRVDPTTRLVTAVIDALV